ncbi:uncharacterized protein P174DRAFT_20314 [Aspergillus novofumigatus IBT 16806]|uniref:Secreted protein n=1 Tax=Aspergillus novofumigatus (strain IBT 16806) TaxID=1392255 RepID=A0A2I1CLL5_ASPN1|nr:uncharacterized protein P174DRAFT_20314 [Aspergillus novofumigatus IBT 16806]PKX98514.1 hypothetical protein P174DRAFT_20314 [Aspergillus novofumigatus IBT 16806]
MIMTCLCSLAHSCCIHSLQVVLSASWEKSPSPAFYTPLLSRPQCLYYCILNHIVLEASSHTAKTTKLLSKLHQRNLAGLDHHISSNDKDDQS